jgi:hypothetical protein
VAKVKYKIQEVKPSIYAVLVPDGYHLAMLFLRYQEYYESPNNNFRGKDFCIWDYMEWYSKSNKGVFSYPRDWAGFNLPLESLWCCLDGIQKINVSLSPYDLLMREIVSQIFSLNGNSCKGYVIGTKDTEGEVFLHEICHGLYRTNSRYKKKAKEIIKEKISPDHYRTFKNNLLLMGYTKKVIDDEIQAYLMYGHSLPKFSSGIPPKDLKRYHTEFKKELDWMVISTEEK